MEEGGPLEEQDQDHPHHHCSSCYSSTCSTQPACPVVHCPLYCNVRLHACKLPDHLAEICPLQTVPCLNSCSGCPAQLPRHATGQHLEHCPASLVLCSQTWNRWPISLRGHQQRQHFLPGQLDYELVVRDQRVQDQLRQVPRRVKVSLRSLFTPRHPPVPLPASCLAVAREPGDRGVRDREFRVDAEGNVVDVVMQNYLRERSRMETAWRKDLEARVGRQAVGQATEATALQREGIHNHCRICVVRDRLLASTFRGGYLSRRIVKLSGK